MNSIEKILLIKGIFNIPELKIVLADRSEKNKRFIKEFEKTEIFVNWRVKNPDKKG